MNNLFKQKPGEEKEEQVDNLESDEALEEVNDHHMEDQVVKTCPSPPSSTSSQNLPLSTYSTSSNYHIQNLWFSTSTSGKHLSPILVHI